MRISSHQTSDVRNTSRLRNILTATALSAMLVLPGALYAQDTQIPAEVMDQLSKQLSAAFTKAFDRKVVISPSIVNIDAKEKTATFEFANSQEDTLVAEVTVGNAPPLGAGASKPGGAKQAGGLLAEDEAADAKAKSDSIDANWSLASWVKDLPSIIKLAPGEKKKITVKLDVPENAKAGEYSGWVVAAVEPADNTPIKIQGADGKPVKMTSGVKLVYRVESK
jgi:hypothetical protein